MSTMGDVGYLDQDGYLHLTDRRSYMIISGGVNIYPQEFENHLITHPKVAEAAVFGVPDADLGEQVKAVVQLHPASRTGAGPSRELIGFRCRHLARRRCRAPSTSTPSSRACRRQALKRLLRDRYWGNRTSRIV